MHIFAEIWNLFKLPVTFAKAQSLSHATDLSTFSGIELESPHKDLVLAMFLTLEKFVHCG